MKLLSLRNRWVSHLGCVAIGAIVCAAVWASVDAWREYELSRSLHGRWTLQAAHVDPAVRQVDVEYRTDGSFVVWQTRTDGTARIIEDGRWWVAGRNLLQEYTTVDGRPLPVGVQQRPEAKLVARADQTLVLVWPAGFQYQYRRAAG